jgi:serine/threonine-protein kinase
MYEMATGRLPFAGISPADTVTNILEKQPTPVTKLSPERSVRLEKIVMKLITKDPDARYQAARDVQDALAATRPKSILGRFGRS